jgi:hypothetical protein
MAMFAVLLEGYLSESPFFLRVRFFLGCSGEAEPFLLEAALRFCRFAGRLLSVLAAAFEDLVAV